MQTSVTAWVTACIIGGGLALPAQAQNGKNPPNVNPTHYQCYSVEAPTSEITLKLIRDQFGVSEAVRLGPVVMLCAPATKNNLPPRDRITHYLCYEDKDAKPANRRAQVINQLTKETGIDLAVQAPTMLCVPSLKRLLQ
jgi:hypothetical protein